MFRRWSGISKPPRPPLLRRCHLSSPDFYALAVSILKKILKGKQRKQEEEYMTDAERRRKIREIKREARRRVRRLRRGEMEDKTG